jgi:hypothetical protein
MLIWDASPDQVVTREAPALAQRLAHLLVRKFVEPTDLEWVEDLAKVPDFLKRLAIAAAAAHAPDSSIEAARLVADELRLDEHQRWPIHLTRILVQRLDKNVDSPDAPPWSAVGLMAGLGHLLTDSVRSEWIQELAETPEGHALLTMPDRLAEG